MTLGFAAGQNIQDTTGNALADTAPTGTNNNTYAVDNTAPRLQSAVVASGNQIVLTYNEAMDTGSVPVSGAFNILGAGTLELAASNPVAVSGSTVTLTLSRAVMSGEGLELYYFPKNTTMPLRDLAGNDADEFEEQSVNSPATGAPAVTAPNVFRVPAVLGVDHSGISDANGLQPFQGVNFAEYQWLRVSSSDVETAITQRTFDDTTYTLTADDVGSRLKVRIWFPDNDRNQEGPLTSAASATITAAATCAAPTYGGGATEIWTGTVAVGTDSSVYGYKRRQFGRLRQPGRHELRECRHDLPDTGPQDGQQRPRYRSRQGSGRGRAPESCPFTCAAGTVTGSLRRRRRHRATATGGPVRAPTSPRTPSAPCTSAATRRLPPSLPPRSPAPAW